MLAAWALLGMASQFLAGWFNKYSSRRKILAAAMLLYGISLLRLLGERTLPQLWKKTVLMEASGGMITVDLFAMVRKLRP